MNNLKKIGLSALAGALVSTSAFAADMSVTGGASITFTGQENNVDGNGWSMNDALSFAGSSDLDNGWTVGMAMTIDNSDGTAGKVIDNRSITVNMGDSGTFTFAGSAGDSVLSAIDDVTPNAYEESWDIISGATAPVSSTTSDNMMSYSNAALVDGLTVNLSYVPSGTAQAEGTSEIGVAYSVAAVEGLTVGYAIGENKASATNNIDVTNAYVTFTTDMGLTFGAQVSESDGQTASGDIDFGAYGLTYAINEDLSIGYSMSEIDYENTTLEDQEANGVSVSYTNGSMTLAGAHNSVDNAGGTSSADSSGYEINLAFAF